MPKVEHGSNALLKRNTHLLMLGWSMGMQAALDEITAHRGTLYDAQVVDLCRSLIESGFQFD